jgi:hypothetical protein
VRLDFLREHRFLLTRSHDPPTRQLMNSPFRLLSIVGTMRSGSTLLDMLLGSHPSVFSGGEICGIWATGYLRGQSCSCGHPPQTCEFWSEVMAKAFNSAQRPDPSPGQVHNWQHESARQRHTRGTIRAAKADPSLAGWPNLVVYRDTLLHLYDSIASVSGRTWVVDSSKLGADLALVGSARSVDSRAVHLTRDPRGVAYPWTRSQVGSAHGRNSVPSRSTIESTLDWLRLNLSADFAIRSLGRTHSIRLRYEDLAMNPGRCMEGISSKLEIPTDATAVTGSLRSEPRHLIGGNPIRFKSELAVTLDEDWVLAMAPWRNLLIGAASSPPAARYGYPLFRTTKRDPK